MWFQGNTLVPEKYKAGVQSWKKNHRKLEYLLWDENKLSNFINDNYPEYFEEWYSLTEIIKKCDVSRYFILHYYGGVYADLDTYVYKSIETLISDLNLYDYDIIFSEESSDVKSWKRTAKVSFPSSVEKYNVVGNAVILSKPGHDFWIEFIDRCFKNKDKNVLESFSTWHLTKFLNEYDIKDSVKVIDWEYLLSVDYIPKKSYVTHNYDAEWINNDTSLPWNKDKYRNPQPSTRR